MVVLHSRLLCTYWSMDIRRRLGEGGREEGGAGEEGERRVKLSNFLVKNSHLLSMEGQRLFF